MSNSKRDELAQEYAMQGLINTKDAFKAGFDACAEIMDGDGKSFANEYFEKWQAAEKEIIEQCRLNAIGQERELKLMADKAELQDKLYHATRVKDEVIYLKDARIKELEVQANAWRNEEDILSHKELRSKISGLEAKNKDYLDQILGLSRRVDEQEAKLKFAVDALEIIRWEKHKSICGSDHTIEQCKSTHAGRALTQLQPLDDSKEEK